MKLISAAKSRFFLATIPQLVLSVALMFVQTEHVSAKSANVSIPQHAPKNAHVLVSENAARAFRAAGTIAICKGSSARLKVSAPGHYSWSPAISLSDTAGDFIYAFPLATTTYTVTGVDEQGNKVHSFVTVKVNEIPAPNVNSEYISSPGKPVVLSATGGSSFNWSPSVGLSSSRGSKVVAAPANSTTYLVTATNKYGCRNTMAVSVVVAKPRQSPKHTTNSGLASLVAHRTSVNGSLAAR